MIVYSDKHKIPFIIDDDDWEIVKHYVWRIHDGYPETHVGFGRVNSTRRTMKLHVLLKGKTPEGLMWDHENRNALDNRRENIRAVTAEINNRNVTKRLVTFSGLSGITRHKRVTGTPCWKVRIYSKGEMRYFGLFETLEAAIAARVEAEHIYWSDTRNSQATLAAKTPKIPKHSGA